MGFVRDWLYRNKFTGKHITTFTHLLLSGGKVNVPEEEHTNFCKVYAKDVVAGNTNFITEMRTPIFKFHMDIDLLETQQIEPEEIIEYCKTIQECIKQFLTWKNGYNSKKLMVIVSMCDEHIKVKNDKEYLKYGIHLNWPYLKVNTYIASILREGCVQYLIQKYGERHSDNTWEDVIDKTVYTNNGLRWIYSDKADKCPDCLGKRKDSKKPEDVVICCTCENSGKIPINRIYEPISIFDGDNIFMKKQFELLRKKQLQYIIKCVQLLSIKCFDKEPNVDIKEPFPSWYKVVDVVLRTKDNKKREQNPLLQDNLSETGEIKKTFSILENLNQEDTRYQMIQEFIENFMPDEYEDARIIEIMFCGKKNSKFRSYIVRTDSKYCQNIQDEHYSNHVYFVITKDRFHQRCFCRCDVVRPSGIKCCDFIDKGKILSTKLKQILFPETLETLNEKKEQIKYNPNKMLETKPIENTLDYLKKYF